MGPGQSGLVVAAGDMSRQAEGGGGHERGVTVQRGIISNCRGPEKSSVQSM